jgi:hypothetical protein
MACPMGGKDEISETYDTDFGMAVGRDNSA